ncbi:MAG: hypothetical protein HOO67_03520, partial [Candidatus Peribacteraceae bacterium]|nr:hypothetical protein [Candidatus Peribacteraceae bacterium]
AQAPDTPQTQPSVPGTGSSSSSNALVRVWSPSMRRMIWVTPSSSSSSVSPASRPTSSVRPLVTYSSPGSSSYSSSSIEFDTRLFDRINRRLKTAAAIRANAVATEEDANASPETTDFAAPAETDDSAPESVTEAEPLENPYADVQSESSVDSDTPADVQPVAAEIPAEPNEEVTSAATSVHANSDKLPQTGFGLDLLAFTALGAVLGSRKAKRS